ncbi:MAG: rhomboid family intramembrane serine protease [Gammaproteobacteria bacterium]|jgi:membrane associated rhomboid family serine protease|nr:rhomboid family intramembrane serine protease [Gammaproteobacteria bacterium]
MFFPISDDNPSNTSPIITYSLIGICLFVFFLQILSEMNPSIYYSFGFIPSSFFNSTSLLEAFFPVITSMFVHGGFAHIIGNLLYLWIFGDNVEDSMGKLRFIIFYILCGTSGAILQGIVDPTSNIPMVGASGAIAGVLGAYLLLFPKANVRCLIFIIIFIQMIRVPAFIVLGIWILGQFFSLPGSLDSSGGTAYLAHIGGFITGMILIPFFKKTNVRLLQEKNSIAWVAESGFNFRQDENKIKNDDLLGKFIEESEEEVRKRK